LKTKPVALALAISAAFDCAQAQSVQTLDPVVVTASRVESLLNPATDNVRSITRQQLEDFGIASVAEAMARLGGATVRGTSLGQLGLNATVDLGGFGVTAPGNTLVLLDGVRLNPIDSAEVPWDLIPFAQVSRIEVMDGAAGVQFGAGVSGGVINIVTKPSVTATNDLSVSVGSFGTVNTAVSVGSASSGLLRFNANHSDGWRTNSQAESASLSFEKRLLLGHGVTDFRAFATQSDVALPGGVVGLVGSGDLKAAKFNNVDSKNLGSSFGVTSNSLVSLGSHTDFGLTAGFVNRSSEFRQPYNDSALSVDRVNKYIGGPAQTWLATSELTVNPSLKFSWLDGSDTTIGLDLSSAAQDGHNRYGSDAQWVILNAGWYYNNVVSDITDAKVLNGSIYVSHLSKMTSKDTLRMGLRRQVQKVDLWDLNKSTTTATSNASGFAGANAFDIVYGRQLSFTQSAYLKVARSFRFANTDEFWGTDNSGNRIFSGILMPQVSKGVEGGWSYSDTKSKIKASVSQSSTSREIRYNPSTYTNSNLADDIRRRHVSLDMTRAITERGILHAGYRYLEAQYDAGTYAGKSIGMVPRHQGSVGLTFRASEKNTLSVLASYTGTQTYDASPSASASDRKMPAYSVLDLSMRHQFDRGITMTVTVKNALDKRYSTYGGYGYVIQSDYAVGASSYYHYPSDPRSVYLSLTSRF
jgi:iron complex outermembrane receptor protein